MTKLFAIISAGLVGLGLLVGVGLVMKNAQKADCAPAAVAGGRAAIGGPFSLINQDGVRVTQNDVITDLSLVYFGFTYCPDICPLDTARNLEAIDILTAKGIDVTPVFITIDPARDTPNVLKDFVEVLHPNLIGLTGSEAEIDAASKAYKTYRSKVGEDDTDYVMDHSTFTYLMSPDGLVEYFRRDVTPEKMADQIACHAS